MESLPSQPPSNIKPNKAKRNFIHSFAAKRNFPKDKIVGYLLNSGSNLTLFYFSQHQAEQEKLEKVGNCWKRTPQESLQGHIKWFCCFVAVLKLPDRKGKGCINAGTLPLANSVHILKIDKELTLVESTRIISIVAKGEETVNSFFYYFLLFYFILFYMSTLRRQFVRINIVHTIGLGRRWRMGDTSYCTYI